MLELKALHLCTYPLTSGITTGTLLSDSKLQWASEYQMSLWKFSWEYIVKRIHGLPQSPSPYKYRVTFQKGAQVSDLLILSMWTGAVLTLPCHSIKLKPWVKIKPWPLHIIIINVIRRISDFPINEQHGRCPTCVMLLPPHTHIHTQTHVDPPICTDAHEHRSKNRQPHTQAHSAPKWVQLTDRGERGAVMQRQGPYTGLHVRCLGIITSNSYAQWFWQAQGRAITAWCRQEWLCCAMTRQWLLLCTSDSHHTNNVQIYTDNQGGSSCLAG